MKKYLFLLFALFLMSLASFAPAETATVRFKGLTVPVDAEEIDLGRVVVEVGEDQKFFRFLESLPNLKKVNMFHTTLIRRRITQYATNFPNIEFGWTMTFNYHVVRTDATALSTRHGSNSERHTEEDFSILKYCKNLQALDIGHNAVKDLSFLEDLPHLKVLILVDNQFTDITPLAELKELQYLELFYNHVEDVSALAGLNSLVDLNICYNRIPDLHPLLGLTNLRRLWIYNSNDYNPEHKLDETMLAQLSQALPDTYIDSVSSSVEGGWREHPHFYTIQRIFAKDGQYEPFEDVAPSGPEQ